MATQQWKYFSEALFINNGVWNDPSLEYKGNTFNYYEIESPIYSDFSEFASENNIEVNEENFEKYCLNNQDSIKEVFENQLEGEMVNDFR